MPNGEEIAVLTVNGQTFQDWESVWVRHRWHEAFHQFKFTAVERDPMPQYWTQTKFKPCDMCTITLGGQMAVNGTILTRQTVYDANSHGVQLSGVSLTYWGNKSSVWTDTMNFDGMTFEQIARKVTEPYNMNIQVVGQLDAKPFDKLSAQYGETVWDFLERIGRDRSVVLGTGADGSMLLIGNHTKPIVSDLIEGVNILRCSCTINVAPKFRHYGVAVQKPSSDQSSGVDANQILKLAQGTGCYPSFQLTNMEHPGDEDDAQKRANFEARWHEGYSVTAQVTVQGWLRAHGSLWTVGDNVFVHSPMAMLDQVLKIQQATFMQDSKSGTTTTLDLVVPWLLEDRAGGGFNPGNPTTPPEPGAATTAPAQPKSSPVPPPPPAPGTPGGVDNPIIPGR
jgi:prophage tail gpP-like protein